MTSKFTDEVNKSSRKQFNIEEEDKRAFQVKFK
jgi:hypothetical protein